MGEISKDQLITEDAANIFKDLTKDALTFKDTLEGIRSSSKTFSDSLTDNNSSASKLRDTVEGLAEDQKALTQVQNQIAIQNQKLTDAYITQAKVLADLKEQQKLKMALGDQDAKSVTAQNSSHVQLGVALNANVKAYSNLTTELQRQSKEGQSLLKTIQDQRKAFNDQSIQMGETKVLVGGYTEAIEKAIPALRGISPQAVAAGEAIQSFGAKLSTLLLNPVVATIAAIIAAFALLKKSVDIYTESTIEGADAANNFSNKWSTVIEVINSKLKKLGKSVFDYFADDKNMMTALNAFSPLLAAVVKYIQLTDEYQNKLKINNEITELQNELKKEEISLTVESATLQLEKEEELNQARDKANRNLQDRYESLLKANTVIKEEIALKTQSANKELEIIALQFKKIGVVVDSQTKINDLFKNENVIKTKSYELVNQLAEAQKKLIDLQAEEFQGARRRQALENQLVDEQINHLLTGIKQEKDARDKLNVEEITEDQQRNARILSNQSSTLNDKVAAETRNLIDLKNLNDKALADELFAFRQQALDKVVLDKKTNDAINAEAGTNLKLRAQLILSAKNKALDDDNTFNSQEFAITEAARLKIEDLTKKSSDNIVKFTIDTHKRMAEAIGSSSGQSKDVELNALEESFAKREISFITYERKKRQIEIQGKNDELDIQNDQLKQDLAYLTSTKTLEEQFADDITKIRKKLADNEAQINANANAKKLAQDKQLYALEKQLANEAFDTVKTVYDNESQARQDALTNQLAGLQSQHDKEITLAGDNATAKAQIDANFAAQQARITKEQNKIKHDQAVADKRVDEAKVLMNTYLAASEALASGPPPGNIIAAALVSAMGALQLVKLESTPIPSYFVGTENHPGGRALVGELGTELVTLPSGQLKLTPNKATVMDLPAGSEVLPNKETMKVLALAGLNSSQIGNTIPLNMTGVINELKEVKNAVKNQKHNYPNYAKIGSALYEFRQESDTHTKRLLAMTLGPNPKS